EVKWGFPVSAGRSFPEAREPPCVVCAWAIPTSRMPDNAGSNAIPEISTRRSMLDDGRSDNMSASFDAGEYPACAVFWRSLQILKRDWRWHYCPKGHNRHLRRSTACPL